VKRFLSILINFIKSLFKKSTPVEDYRKLSALIPEIIAAKSKAKKAAIIRRRKASKLSQLSKPKRRAVYYYNLRHPVKMYA